MGTEIQAGPTGAKLLPLAVAGAGPAAPRAVAALAGGMLPDGPVPHPGAADGR